MTRSVLHPGRAKPTVPDRTLLTQALLALAATLLLACGPAPERTFVEVTVRTARAGNYLVYIKGLRVFGNMGPPEGIVELTRARPSMEISLYGYETVLDWDRTGARNVVVEITVEPRQSSGDWSSVPAIPEQPVTGRKQADKVDDNGPWEVEFLYDAVSHKFF
jgi:hypothetical protein